MTINERFFELLNQSSDSQKKFCEDTGIPQSTLSAWKKRKTDPPAELIFTIANYLGVSVEYLLTGINQPPNLSKEERILLEIYDSLDHEGQTILLGKAYDLKREQRQHAAYEQEEEMEREKRTMKKAT